MGKGSARRPKQVSDAEFDANWERAFRGNLERPVDKVQNTVYTDRTQETNDKATLKQTRRPAKGPCARCGYFSLPDYEFCTRCGEAFPSPQADQLAQTPEPIEASTDGTIDKDVLGLG